MNTGGILIVVACVMLAAAVGCVIAATVVGNRRNRGKHKRKH